MTAVRERLPDWRAGGQRHRIPSASERAREIRGSIAETYLREARAYGGPLPPTLGFLPARRGYPPPMIAAFGIPDEPEPGVMFLPNASIRGMHLTRLAPDGSDRDRGERAKIIIGTWPAAHCGGAHG